MRFSIWPSNQLSWPELVDIAHFAEIEGWDGLWVADHFMGMDEHPAEPITECWTALAALATTVTRLRLGTLVSSASFRHPGLLVKMATTIDRVSGGRMVLGLGAGWQRNEHDAYGIPFGTKRERLDRLAEACEVVSAMFREPVVDFTGRYFRLREAVAEPKPVRGHLPLLVGGGGERITMRVAARFADEWNTWGTPETIAAKSAVLDRHCVELGRDPQSVLRSAQALLYLGDNREALAAERAAGPDLPALVGTVGDLRAEVDRYARAGVTELIVPDFNLGPPARKKEILRRFRTEVIEEFR